MIDRFPDGDPDMSLEAELRTRSPEQVLAALALSDKLNGIPDDVIRASIYFTGSWDDQALDVPRHEVFELLKEPFGEALEKLENHRAEQAWNPAEIFLTGGGASLQKEMGGLWRVDSNDPNSKIVWRADELGENGLFLPNPEILHEEGENATLTQRLSLFINGLTEDNLPNYARLFAELYGGEEAATAYLRQWLADEDLHKLGFDTYMLLSQTLNPYMLQQQRTKIIKEGQLPANGSIFDNVAYVSFQEPAAEVSHRNTPKSGLTIKTFLGHTATHEGQHAEGAQSIGDVLMQHYPDQMTIAIRNQVLAFEMPGEAIKSYRLHAAILNWAGVFDTVETHNIMVDVIKRFGVFEYDGELHPEAEQARIEIAEAMLALRDDALKLEADRARHRDSGEPDRKIKDPLSVYRAREPVKVAREKSVRDSLTT